MADTHRTLLLTDIDPPQALFSTIVARIARARQRAARIRLVAFGTLAFVSVVTLVPVVQYTLNEFYASGFYEYASLFLGSFSNGYGQELFYSLIDSVPSFALLLLMVTGTVLVWSVRRANHDVRIAFTQGAVPA